ncbi:hypothetical protein WJX73_009648 [Symbiochloris irregularis]|uniref:Uncharacterized protein n=1 Tax=Symbiochloris irregularis TaxID=706552 RepID=A0AAW1PMI1_9CHLO
MTNPEQAALENRLKKLRESEAHAQNSDEEDESPSGELSVQARVDSVALAKGRLSSGATSAASQHKDRSPTGDRSGLPPKAAAQRSGSSERQKATGFKGVTRKLRTSLGFGEKDKSETAEKHAPELATHVSFNDRVEEVPVEGGAR